MTNPTAAMLVIGDEILSGRTRDANLHHLARRLAETGIDLKEARIVSDTQSAIVAALDALRAEYTYVFTSGGIGPTHDDITADAVARAFGAGIGVRDDARAILADHYAARGAELTEARLRMARIPDGARLIANPVSAAPGFSMQNVHVMAGVPAVFNAMLEEVLALLDHGSAILSESVRVDRPESEIAGPLSQIASDNPAVSLGSYPYQLEGRSGADIVIRGADAAQVAAAAQAVRAAFGEAAA